MENLYEKIERYLQGELAGSELTDFENALQSDATLAKSVAQHRELQQRLDALRLRKKVAAVLEQGRTRPVSGFLKGALTLSVLLLTVIAVAIWFWAKPAEKPVLPADDLPQNTPGIPTVTPAEETPVPIAEKPPEKTIEKPNLIALARKFQEQPAQTFVRDATQPAGDSASKTPAQQAAEAYYAQNFRLAADLLKEDRWVLQDEEARYLRAHARFNIGQFAGAAKDFDALKGSFQFKHEARWNYLLCQIALGNTREANGLLSEMLKEEDFPFRAKALELKEKFGGF